ncbi:efflux transporter outer membrane subunit [Chromobacterium violaceum]|uniref:Probable efflux pump outer membrane protein ttgC n=1 Tax=Chromobacterium violaceum TaxID=536 RepID=A0AAX2MAD0_CHRVL|nr:efflux transporter outer membrane subunit [Chromobacterium violaceum]OLZ84468.1 RND transporter [Chromobacterium violaceum]STB71127.1 Probable efflux pump outer membrane protein ttgC precursor [Chromobacterium violaceum]SUX33265.1 Probable efflux pump outer membrane protein ttgC precursor [Chromobacterium violaceum]
MYSRSNPPPARPRPAAGDGPSSPAPWRRLALLALVLAQAGCAVGPDFKPPALPDAAKRGYAETPLPATTASDERAGPAGAGQRLVNGGDLPAQWWTLFRSPELDQLIRAALAHNPSLEAAQAALAQARENYNAASGSLLFPNVNAQLGGGRQRAILSGTAPSEFNVYSATVNVSYTLDLFGGSRRQLEGLMAAADYQRFQTEAAYQTLIANVVTAAVQEASLRGQLQSTRELLKAQEAQLAIVDKQVALGAQARAAALSQGTLVAQTRAQLQPLEKALSQTRNLLATLAGRFPGEGGLPEFRLESLRLPDELPVSLPSDLARQRPDIRASEALLHQASANVGVATANQYPQITLSGSYGTQHTVLPNTDLGNTLWSVSGGLLQPLFNGGALSAKRRAAEAAYRQAEAQYRTTVLKAFQDVADSLRAVDADARALQAQADAEAKARESLEVHTRQYKLGGISYLSLLDAQRSYQQARIGLIQAQAARYSDSAALFAALGGGWWQQPAAAN